MDRNLTMFKAYDIRTKNERLDDEALESLAASIAKYYKEDVGVSSVVVARDARLYSPRLAEAIIEALTSAGLDVYVNPLQIGTCEFYFMCMKMRASGGIMVTASHNPAEYVGLKFVGRDVSPIATGCGPAGGIEKIREYYLSDAKAYRAHRNGQIHLINMLDEYVDYSMKLAGVKEGSLEGLKVFGEFLSGAAGAAFLMAFDRAGSDLSLSDLVPNGLFPMGDPNPIVESSIAPARKKMRKKKHALGFCFDGDGDRMDLMFSDGSQIIPGLNMSIIVPYIKEIFSPVVPEEKIKIFVDVKAIPLSVIEIANRGIEPHIIRNGHSFIKEKLRDGYREGYVLSEEESAHYYMNFPYDSNDIRKGVAPVENTLFFALLSARAMKERRDEYERIHEIQRSINRYREWPLNFECAEKMEEIMEEVENAMRARGAAIIKEMDDGSDLDATLMRFNLPERFSSIHEFPSIWAQVAERISRSEDAMTRWEVVASSPDLARELNDAIRDIARKYVEKGWAHF